MVRAVILAMALLAGLNSSVDAAGVRGGSFSGTINATIGNSAEAILVFSVADNTRVESQSIGGIANTYPGTYTEFDLVLFSYWTGTFEGLPTYQVSGISFLGIVTSYSLTNNGEPAASGFLVRFASAGVDEEEPQ